MNCLPSDRLQERIAALIAERDSARDRFIRMEGRHETLKRKSAKRRKDLAKAVGESPAAPMDVLIIMAADQRAYLAELRAELQAAYAERQRLTIANAGLNEDIADLEHEPSPRVWPDVAPEGVERVQDHEGDVWFLRHGKWRLGLLSCSWGELLDKHGPVTEVIGGESWS